MPEFNPDRVTIKDLVVEEPEVQSELPFDVEREITKEDIEYLKQIILLVQTQPEFCGL